MYRNMSRGFGVLGFAGVLDIDACENVSEEFKELEVLKTVGYYVQRTIREKMGPSFLELAWESILNDDALSKATGLDEVSELRSAPIDVSGGNKKRYANSVKYAEDLGLGPGQFSPIHSPNCLSIKLMD
ncbi:hypothetical protein L1987_75198 [Smallanthus sonchifolius]|uniref:Uncharacterized protein n=1 Tax=Smallanthus sonchifolius TaxID=185202 RepID=A0ACB9A516_9ASTR|nr:hypothetical protein L1987_75198 [Smallanthus sonchifolius]